MLGTEVTAVDPAAKELTLSNGETMWLRHAGLGDRRRSAAAVVPRRASLPGVHPVRTRADCDRLMGEIDGGVRNVVVIGGGYIGLEAAAVLTKLGCKVTLLEALPRVLARVAGEELSALLRGRAPRPRRRPAHRREVEAIEGEDRVTGVQAGDGEMIPGDVVIVGIGIVPAVGPLIAAGAAGANGVDVDEFCRTRLPDVYAIGDCAAYASRLCRRHGDPARKRAERQRHGDLRRQGDLRRSAAVRRVAVVLVEPVRPAPADRRAHRSATTPPCCAATRPSAASRWSTSRAAR